MSEGSITVRRATSADRDTIVSFNTAMALETEGLQLDAATLRSGVSYALKNPRRCIYFVAQCDEQLVGQTMVTYEWSDWRNGHFWWIQSVYVDPGFRRRGVYRALHWHIREAATKEADVCGIRLYVHYDNQRAQQTYRKLGLLETSYRLYEERWDR